MTVTIDDALAEETGSIDFLKMDVEGSECNILEGAKGVMARSPQMKIIMEWNLEMQYRAGSDPKQCLQKLADHGYIFYIIRH